MSEHNGKETGMLSLGVKTHHDLKQDIVYPKRLRLFRDLKSMAKMEGDFPPLVLIMFILCYLSHSHCITRVIQNLIRAAMNIKRLG